MALCGCEEKFGMGRRDVSGEGAEVQELKVDLPGLREAPLWVRFYVGGEGRRIWRTGGAGL